MELFGENPALVAQRIERDASIIKVVGSTPAEGTIYILTFFYRECNIILIDI